MRKSKRAVILIVVGVALLCCAGGLHLKNVLEDKRAGDFAKTVIRKMLSAQPYVDKETELLFVSVDSQVYCGRIIIEKIDLELPVFAEWNENNLNFAPCLYSGNHRDDNLIIAAHNYKSQFRRLGDVELGDAVVFSDAAGNEYTYTVRHISKLDGTAVSDMHSGDWDMTLFTCTPGGKQRLTLRCEKNGN